MTSRAKRFLSASTLAMVLTAMSSTVAFATPTTTSTDTSKAPTSAALVPTASTPASATPASAVPASTGTSIGARVATTKSKITVTRTAANALRVAWPKRTGATSYVVIASGAAGELASATTRATGATITDLKTTTRYTFIITPMKGSTALTPMRAVMTQPLTGTQLVLPADTSRTADGQAAVEVADTSPTNSAPSITPAPAQPAPSAPAPSAPSAPKMKTIWECPAGYVDVDNDCITTLSYTYHDVTTTREYTYHDVTTTRDYTYHSEFVLTGYETYQGPCDRGGTSWPDGRCGLATGYTVSVKDATPAGFTDNGSTWTRTDAVKDATPAGFTDNGSTWTRTDAVKDGAPAGYSDDGTQWVKHTAKVSRTVPA